MKRMLLTSSACLASLAGTAHAQTTPNAPAESANLVDSGEIIVTATRREQSLQDVPLAVSAFGERQLSNAGISDIRQLNQLTPSLLVSSGSSEASGTTARIRGIGTSGENPGLEAAVATFVDGVYRSRSGVAFTDLGQIERIEVLRGPQGTLFGRNASAGLIHVITKAPEHEFGGFAEATYGNYDNLRLAGGVTGGISDSVAGRLDAVFHQRDGFLRDIISGRSVNDRDRWGVRGQFALEPTAALDVRVIADYATRDEECCAAGFQPPRLLVKQADGSVLVSGNNPVLALERSLGGIIVTDPDRRITSITPGRSQATDIEDWGGSAEINWNAGFGNLTSITAYRDWTFKRGQDGDFSNLDIIYRDGWRQNFRTFTQELRLQGTAFDDRLDWLVGGYYADETLDFTDNLKFGADYQRFVEGVIRLSAPTFPGYGPSANLLTSALARPGLAGQSLASRGAIADIYRQKSKNWAAFTHNVVNITDALSVTLGLRYTEERKRLDASLSSDNQLCTGLFDGFRALAANPAAFTPIVGAANNGLLNALLVNRSNPATPAPSTIVSLGCLGNNGTFIDGAYGDRRKESRFSGTGVVSYEINDDLLTYASYSKGYKAGGFNLDRAAFSPNDILAARAGGAINPASRLQFQPETVDAYEIGAKFSGGDVSINSALFYQKIEGYQLNTFNGLTFVVENIEDVTSKGFEIDFLGRPVDDLALTLGFALSDSQYDADATGTGGRPLPAVLSALPGRQISNAARYTVGGSAAYEPEIGANGLTALLYADFRYQSEINTGSDLDLEKVQPGFLLVNARIGVYGEDKRWGVEFWGQNLFDADFRQIDFDLLLRGSGSQRAIVAGPTGTRSTQLFGSFPGEPRTYGVTLKTQF